MPFYLVRNDITRMDTDAIVNAANENLVHAGGVAAAIADAAGRKQMDAASAQAAPCPTGDAVWTPGFELPTKYVIHAVGPVWHGGEHNEVKLLERAYLSSLGVARRLGCRSVAFPLISAGIFGFPQEDAFQIAIDAIGSFLTKYDMDVYLVLFDSHATEIGKRLDPALNQFIDDTYAEMLGEDMRSARFCSRGLMSGSMAETKDSCQSEPGQFKMAPPCFSAFNTDRETEGCSDALLVGEFTVCKVSGEDEQVPPADLGDWLKQLDASFSDAVFALIDVKGLDDPQVYKRVHMSRQAFAKLRQPGYHPKKATAVVIAIALELNYQQTQELLARAGYTLSRSNLQDRVVEFFIRNGIWDLAELNHALWERDLPLLQQTI